MRKWLPALLYVSGIMLAFMYRYTILDWLSQDHNLILAVGTATLLALFPVLPYKAVISIYGYAYGSLGGGAICWIATTLAAALMFGGARWMFRDRALAYLASVKPLHKFTSAVRRQPFFSIVLARLLPVVPQAAVNVYAGAAGLPFWRYTIASGIGKIPGIFLFAFLGGNLLEHPDRAAAALLTYAAVLGTAIYTLRPGFRKPE